LYKDLIVTPRSSPAARNRFIYYPDHLVQLPSPDPKLSMVDNIKRFKKVLKEPLFENLVPGIFRDILSPPRHPTDWAKDESVADFIGRRFGPNVAENVVSAVMHGIYAGDIDQLSAQTLAGPIRNLEGGIGGVGGFVSGGIIGSLISRAFTKTKTRSVDDFMAIDAISAGAELVRRQHDLERLVAGASTFTFKRGVGQLGEALAASLKASPKVKIHKNMEIKSLRKLRDSSSISVCSSDLFCPFQSLILIAHRLNSHHYSTKHKLTGPLSTMSSPQFPQYPSPTLCATARTPNIRIPTTPHTSLASKTTP
jgi:oxygen-dependent protoporphyrinogen oxidase